MTVVAEPVQEDHRGIRCRGSLDLDGWKQCEVGRSFFAAHGWRIPIPDVYGDSGLFRPAAEA